MPSSSQSIATNSKTLRLGLPNWRLSKPGEMCSVATAASLIFAVSSAAELPEIAKSSSSDRYDQSAFIDRLAREVVDQHGSTTMNIRELILFLKRKVANFKSNPFMSLDRPRLFSFQSSIARGYPNEPWIVRQLRAYRLVVKIEAEVVDPLRDLGHVSIVCGYRSLGNGTRQFLVSDPTSHQEFVDEAKMWQSWSELNSRGMWSFVLIWPFSNLSCRFVA